VQLVYEKEKGLRMMMRMHSLGDGAYWLVMYSWFLPTLLLMRIHSHYHELLGRFSFPSGWCSC
jgi:hypothetical protein